MKKFITELHYLTQDLDNRSHIEQTQIACEAGCKWVQYRCFTKTDEQMLEDLHVIASICDDWGATLIITDHVHLLEKADIQGVHIEDMQADFSAIREQIGEARTFGASAHTFENIQRIAASNSVDYIGCGPFAHTDTKPNAFSLLSLSDYETIAQKMKEEHIKTPLLAVGGIKIEDVDALMKTGIFGVAVSAAINKAEDPAAALKEIYRKVY